MAASGGTWVKGEFSAARSSRISLADRSHRTTGKIETLNQERQALQTKIEGQREYVKQGVNRAMPRNSHRYQELGPKLVPQRYADLVKLEKQLEHVNHRQA